MVAEGVTAIVTTAYLDEAERCDRVALLDQGRVIALDSPARLQARCPGGCSRCTPPSRAARATWLAALPGVRHRHALGRSRARAGRGGCALDAAALRDELEAAGVSVLSVDAATATLEDVFIARVARPRPRPGAWRQGRRSRRTRAAPSPRPGEAR